MIIAKEKHFPRKACREIYQTNNIILYINRRREIEYIVLGIYCVRSKGQRERRKQRRKKERWERNNSGHPSGAAQISGWWNQKQSKTLYGLNYRTIGTLILIKTLKYGCFITVAFIAINF